MRPDITSAADDGIDLVGEIYAAVGNAERWQRLNDQLATRALSAEVRSHLDVARRAHEQLLVAEREIAILTRVHDRVALGVLVVNTDGRLLTANTAAHRLLAEGSLRLSEGRLEAGLDADNDTLRRALERGTSGVAGQAPPAGPFVLVSRLGLPPLSLVLLPIQERLRFFEDRGTVLVLVIDHGRGSVPNMESLRQLFDLTTREAELAWLLAQGRSVHEAAELLDVSINTARTLLARVTAKTDSHSQAELVRQLLAIPH